MATMAIIKLASTLPSAFCLLLSPLPLHLFTPSSVHLLIRMWPDAPETQELIAQAKAGDRAAIEQLLARHREALRRMIDLRMDQMVRRRVDASDIVDRKSTRLN